MRAVSRFLKEIAVPLAAVAVGLAFCALVLAALGENPIEIYRLLWEGAFGSARSAATTLNQAAPLFFTGLSCAFAFRCGLFNIGVEGQFALGALAAGVIGAALSPLPAFLALPLILASGAAAGAALAIPPHRMKEKNGVHEVIGMLMINAVVFSFAAWVVQRTGISAGDIVPATHYLNEAHRLPKLNFIAGGGPHAGFLLGLAALAAAGAFFNRTKAGFELRAIGSNPEAARWAGVAVSRRTLLALLLAGAAAGAGGAAEVAGVYGRFFSPFPFGIGYTGLAVTLCGRNRPAGIFVFSILFGAFMAGGIRIDLLSDVPRELTIALEGATLIFMMAGDRLLQKRLEAFKAGGASQSGGTSHAPETCQAGGASHA